jgi:hypothetical protein
MPWTIGDATGVSLGDWHAPSNARAYHILYQYKRNFIQRIRTSVSSCLGIKVLTHCPHGVGSQITLRYVHIVHVGSAIHHT